MSGALMIMTVVTVTCWKRNGAMAEAIDAALRALKKEPCIMSGAGNANMMKA